MAADGARSGVHRVALAVELDERAHQGHAFSPRGAIITFERRSDFGRHVRPAGRKLGIHRIAEVLCAVNVVCKIRDAFQVAAVTMAGWDRAKRPVGFADDVKSASQAAGARGVHGEVAGIVDCAFTHPLQIKRARPLQDHWGDLSFAFSHMGLQPIRIEPGQLRRK
jgi:hypothetical protein